MDQHKVHNPEATTGRLSHRRLHRLTTWIVLAAALIFFATAIAGVAVSRPFLPGLERLFGFQWGIVAIEGTVLAAAAFVHLLKLSAGRNPMAGFFAVVTALCLVQVVISNLQREAPTAISAVTAELPRILPGLAPTLIPSVLQAVPQALPTILPTILPQIMPEILPQIEPEAVVKELPNVIGANGRKLLQAGPAPAPGPQASWSATAMNSSRNGQDSSSTDDSDMFDTNATTMLAAFIGLVVCNATLLILFALPEGRYSRRPRRQRSRPAPLPQERSLTPSRASTVLVLDSQEDDDSAFSEKQQQLNSKKSWQHVPRGIVMDDPHSSAPY
ncbi:hypothetical protein WJX73_008803 [Symbiochloris irregularis]|uniref:Uncharacterized protein n=1 Tax=Symbiochloris irregularis TaxID=706552 RepID=A0AAW1P1G1_9CHLO